MNLFVTHVDPVKAATHLDDKRIGSALREACQMMSLAIKYHSINFDESLHCGEGKVTKGMSHLNHPVSLWVRSTLANWNWTWDYASALIKEYELRYGKTHGASPRVEYLTPFRTCLPVGGLLSFQNSAKNDGLGLDFTHLPVPKSYRQYLIARWETDKRAVTFQNRGAPEWSRSRK